jgi:hypothetical protein
MSPYFIVVDLQPSDEDEAEVLLDELCTTREEEPELLGRFIVIGPLSVQEVGAEMFALGACFERIEQEQDIIFPFDFVVLTERPTDADELDMLFDAKQAIQLQST